MSPIDNGMPGWRYMSPKTQHTSQKSPSLALTAENLNSKPPFFDSTEMINFICGGVDVEARVISIHKDVVIKASGFLEEVFKVPVVRGLRQECIMGETDPNVFAYLLPWFYYRKVIFSFHNKNPEKDKKLIDAQAHNHELECAEEEVRVIKLWILAEILHIPKLQNKIIRRIKRAEDVCGILTSRCYKVIYDETKEGSPLRRLTVAQYAWARESGKYSADLLPPRMPVDLVNLYSSQVSEAIKDQLRTSSKAADYYVDEKEAKEGHLGEETVEEFGGEDSEERTEAESIEDDSLGDDSLGDDSLGDDSLGDDSSEDES